MRPAKRLGNCDVARVLGRCNLFSSGNLQPHTKSHESYVELAVSSRSSQIFLMLICQLRLSMAMVEPSSETSGQPLGHFRSVGCSTPGHRQVCHWHRSSAEALPGGQSKASASKHPRSLLFTSHKDSQLLPIGLWLHICVEISTGTEGISLVHPVLVVLLNTISLGRKVGSINQCNTFFPITNEAIHT